MEGEGIEQNGRICRISISRRRNFHSLLSRNPSMRSQSSNSGSLKVSKKTEQRAFNPRHKHTTPSPNFFHPDTRIRPRFWPTPVEAKVPKNSPMENPEEIRPQICTSDIVKQYDCDMSLVNQPHSIIPFFFLRTLVRSRLLHAAADPFLILSSFSEVS